jgi:hypothetical protein
MVIGASEKAEYCSASEYRVQTVDPSVELLTRAESQSQAPGTDFRESSENVKVRSGVAVLAQIGCWASAQPLSKWAWSLALSDGCPPGGKTGAIVRVRMSVSDANP